MPNRDTSFLQTFLLQLLIGASLVLALAWPKQVQATPGDDYQCTPEISHLLMPKPRRLFFAFLPDPAWQSAAVCDELGLRFWGGSRVAVLGEDASPQSFSLSPDLVWVFGLFANSVNWLELRADQNFDNLAPDLFEDLEQEVKVRAGLGFDGEAGDLGADLEFALSYATAGKRRSADQNVEIGPAKYGDFTAEVWIWPLYYRFEDWLSWVNIPLHAAWRYLSYGEGAESAGCSQSSAPIDCERPLHGFEEWTLGTGIYSRYLGRPLKDGQGKWLELQWSGRSYRGPQGRFSSEGPSIQDFKKLSVRSLGITDVLGFADDFFFGLSFDFGADIIDWNHQTQEEFAMTLAGYGGADQWRLSAGLSRGAAFAPMANEIYAQWRFEAEAALVPREAWDVGGRIQLIGSELDKVRNYDSPSEAQWLGALYAELELSLPWNLNLAAFTEATLGEVESVEAGTLAPTYGPYWRPGVDTQWRWSAGLVLGWSSHAVLF